MFQEASMAKDEKFVFGGSPGKVDKEKFINALRGRWMNQKCPLCGMASFTICDDFIQTIYYPGIGLGAGAGYPMVMLVCNTCGNTLFFNAVKLDLVPGASNVS
jgi:ribosomal protein S27E